MKKLSLSAVAIAMASSSLPLYADEAAEVVVTASRTAESVDDTTASVTVITRDDIEASQAQDVIELLRLQAGVEVSRYGGPGTATSVFLRGTNSNEALVLVDGVRVSSATFGSFAWQSLDPNQIERIEIVRGPMASVYGSDTIGGVISITTRRPKENDVTVMSGSYGTQALTTNLSKGDKNNGYGISITGQQSNGFSATNSSEPYGNYNADNDGYNYGSLSSSYTKTINKQTRLNTRLWFNSGTVDYDIGATTPAYSNNRNMAFNVGLQTQVGDDQVRRFNIGFAGDDADDVGYGSRSTTQRIMLSWQNNIQKSKDHFSVYGWDLDNAHVYYNDGFNTILNTTNNLGVYWLSNKKHDNKTLQISVRGDYHSAYGFHPSGSIAWVNRLSTKNRIGFSLGSAYHAPTFYDLYYPGTANPNLQPETSINAEFSWQHRVSSQRLLKLNVYYNDITNLIQLDGSWVPQNIGHARIPGMELIVATKKGKWRNSYNLTLQDPRNAIDGSALPRRANAILSITNQRKLSNKGNIGSELLWSSSRIDGSYTLSPYLLWNWSANYPVSKRGTVSLRVENVLDSQYEYAYGYNTPGRSFYLGYKQKL